ncbi:MAG: hypothetical protein A2277_07485 [Desulfobacterales bacterium RIFOXYA12_FULL_46_15]|nr:MAG: hypothetical protein A2097_13795 [Desulfobacula sp. GWF2_41_7]OGR28493.1 MAG: hypothetical protein A2277_07485 [Desulfobacterales bacterium RIFOXYA12_FULL_46_15]
MKKQGWISFIFLFLLGCATPGQKFIDITYKADHEKTQTGTIGIAPFKDKRADRDGGYVGYRLLMDNSQETFFVQGMNLADTLKKSVGDYFEKTGFTITPVGPWELSPNGVMNAGEGFKQIVAGHINKFECRAKKKGGTTDMVFEIDLTLFIGKKSNTNEFKTIPVALTLERTEMTFTPEKLEAFVNQSVEEVIQKALKQ